MKLLILDRDGVINHDSDHYIKSPDEWRPVPGSMEAIALLTQSGWRIAVATNQSGISRGLFSAETLNAIHAKMHKAVTLSGGRIEAVFYCPDSAESNSPCRKPNPGMLHAIAERFNTPLAAVPMVGDSLRDLQAASTAGAKPFLVLSGKGRKTRKQGGLPEGTRIFRDLAAVARELLH
ncbi:MAG: D-glycero-beta-D-manno-heptose 1,7-bisphosphate 7-phosphatase [Burkholderiales bacterium]